MDPMADHPGVNSGPHDAPQKVTTPPGTTPFNRIHPMGAHRPSPLNPMEAHYYDYYYDYYYYYYYDDDYYYYYY